MYQTTIDDFLTIEDGQSFAPTLISCETESGFHWIRITTGCVPIQFIQFVEIEDNDGYADIHVNTKLRDKIIASFNGIVKKHSGGLPH